MDQLGTGPYTEQDIPDRANIQTQPTGQHSRVNLALGWTTAAAAVISAVAALITSLRG